MKKKLFLLSIVYFYDTYGVPLVQRIANNTQIGFEVIAYSDRSPCSTVLENQQIDANTVFRTEFLIEKSEGSGLTLRPVYYKDSATGIKISLVDAHKQFDYKNIEQAYNIWKKSGNKRKFADAQDWFKHWVGQDIEVKPYTCEVFGYLINLSRVQICNSVQEKGTWLSFAKGVFAKLVLEVDIVQHGRKGIMPTVKVIAGEGGICTDGMIERL